MTLFRPEWGARTYVMGILNVTSDSFSGDGITDAEQAIARGEYLAAHGADVIDVGGESSRPGASPVDAAEELQRVVPVIEALCERIGIPLSVDTRKAEVAEAAMAAGASIVNDVQGFRQDPELAAVVAGRGGWAIAMHNRAAAPKVEPGVGGYFPEASYGDVVEEVIRDLEQSAALLRAAGVPPERIIVDPGIGFGKTPEQSLRLVAELGRLRILGYPILLGTSRKSFIGVALGGIPPSERLEGTAATVALGIQAGADMVRVHDLPAMGRVARMADAIVRRT